MKEPNGTDLLATLIALLADQEGVKIEFKIEGGSCKGKEERKSSVSKGLF